MGILVFDESTRIKVPYRDYNICQVLRFLNKKKAAKKLSRRNGNIKKKNTGPHARYKLAFAEMKNQINKYQKGRKTLIFFITDYKNTGPSYEDILNDLRKNHVVYVIGITRNQKLYTELENIASKEEDHRILIMKLQSYDDLRNMAKELAS